MNTWNLKSAMRAALIDDVLSYKLDAAFISAPVNMAGLNQESIIISV